MNGNCFDIGKIQAFLDGELSHEESAAVSSHAALCPSCAHELAVAEDESTAVFAALEREFDSLVPTHRLWNKINEQIVVEKQNAPIWTKILAGIRTVLVTPSLAVAASLVIVLGLTAAIYLNRQPTVVDPPQANGKSAPVVSSKPDEVVPPQAPPTVARADYRSDNGFRVDKAIYRESASKPPAENYLPGEASYVRTIGSLSKTVDQQKENGVLRPSERVSYERDMAVVNDAIKKLRKEVKKDPKNDSAKQILYASYQNKIDLLNSVAQREELVASLR